MSVVQSGAVGLLRAERLLQFDVEDLHCIIDAACVVQILRAAALAALPGAPAFIAGIVNVHGDLLPVLDLRVRFGFPERGIVPSDRFITIRVGERVIALWVDAVLDVFAMNPRDIVPAQGLLGGLRSLSGLARTAEGMLYLHDPTAFLSESEAEALDLLGAVS
jgi:purine-binding chemotaxis protein CheW